MSNVAVDHRNRNRAAFAEPFVVELQAADGRELGRRPLADAQLLDLRGELWFNAYPRRGTLDVPQRLSSLVVAGKMRADGRCDGFRAVFEGPDELRIERDYDVDLVGDTATSLVCQALADERLKRNDTYVWSVRRDPAAGQPTRAELGFSVEVTDTPLEFVTGSFPALKAMAEAVGPIDDRDIPVFFLRQAWEKGERFARMGAERTPAVETGAVYVGVLAHCRETNEAFVVVEDALQLADAEQEEFSLTLTGATWVRVQAVLAARRKSRRAVRLLGQCHGHNFLPAGGAPPCEHCAKAEVCTRTSVFLSDDDRRFMRSVMPGQAYQLSYIAGFNARKEQVGSLYGIRDGRLAARGYYLIDRFEQSA